MEWICINGWWIWIHVKIVSAQNRILPLFKIWLYKQWYDTWQMWLQRSVWAQQPLTWWMTGGVLGLSEATASPPLSLVRPEAAHSRVPGLINGHQAGILASVPSQPFMALQHCGRLGFCGFWKRFSAVFDGNCCSFVLCPATSRPPSWHLHEAVTRGDVTGSVCWWLQHTAGSSARSKT